MRILALLLFLVFLLFAIAARHFYICEIKGMCGSPETYEARLAAPVADVRAPTLQLLDGDTVRLQGYDQFAFDSARVAPRLNANNERFLDTLARLLAADTAKRLTITGYYRAGEEGIQPGFFENLGLARADTIRQMLGGRGVAQERISIDYGRSNDPNLTEPLTFSFYTPSDLVESYEKLQFTFNNMTFSDANFAFDSDVFEPGEPFRMYADSVATYLRLYPESRLTIIGHTDDRGTVEYNLDLGMRRGRNAREYFINQGVENEILVQSEGEGKPAASNRTAEGRQKNRRVNFVLN